MATIWERPVQYLKGVGPQRARWLSRLGINTVGDLLYHLPRRYEDRTFSRPLQTLVDGETVTARGEVLTVEESTARSGLKIIRAALRHPEGTFYAVWFNQTYLTQILKPGVKVTVTGKVRRLLGFIEIQVADFEIGEDEEGINSGRIVPIYPSTEKLPQRTLRSLIFRALEENAAELPELLPPHLLRQGFFTRAQALREVHFPSTLEKAEEARKRLVLEELFLLQLALGQRRRHLASAQKPYPCRPDGPLVQQFLASLPFTLTPAQERAWREISRDMESPRPMHRLLQGDVGAGKTVVAALALVKAVENGLQGALMAPTEILAEQHFLNLHPLLEKIGIKVGLLTGNLKKELRWRQIAAIARGDIDVVIGTHTLIQEEVSFHRLGLVVIDEQHRFGVRQRTILRRKGEAPDVLVMTATPIPRTLALTLYGDLDLSVIDSLPPGRQPVKTIWIKPSALPRVYNFIRQEAAQGNQAFFVCPLIEESEELNAQAASKLAEELKKFFPEFQIGLLHGRLKLEEKERVMAAFRSGEIKLLVTTSVVEVGVDVPNATVMVIYDADRFGLAQLHQLRGRVGRSDKPSYCILVADKVTPEAQARLKAFTNLRDGFALAEEDLRIRGPGEFFGTRQSGLPELKVADLLRDHQLLPLAREEAWRFLEKDPSLSSPLGRILRQEIALRFAAFRDFVG
ncbi:ATP-dependent DNA helicase RecG [Ammonifex degensii KC4]|uniref:ATP-dependent DNA helicase RecG n=1 Tax=Ammonifex degensii (strain DSM 10501 / KC4) TaxID=429009 RepID=C9RAM3_AMMDK|nr:ATP-dependent DNA helicase RecG [Ammonifex degensii]ACX51300.1 ATP-dependent DNA helicase RecG [Ammonifex degensii KC4]